MEKKKFNLLVAVSLVTSIAALVLIVVCIWTDEWDDVFLPIALGLTIVSNFVNYYRTRKKK